jgi:HK97 family phage major capsid protein
MKMSIDQILEKAFATGDLATGGLLNPDQAAKFVQGIFDSAVITKECRREPMTANKKQIDKITYGTKVLQKPEAVGTAHTTTTKPTTSKVELSAEEVIVALDLGYDALEDSIEGKGIMDTIMALTQSKMGPEMDELVLFGDKDGATGTALDCINGIFKKVSAHTLDASSATLSDTVLFNTLKQLPGKYLDNDSQYRYYVSHLARLDYVKALADKNVNDAFTRYVLEANEPSYQGIPVRKVGAINTENIGGGTPAVLGSKGLLINPANIVLGIHRDIQFEMMRQPRKRIVEVTITMRLDVAIEEEDAVVKMLKIKHST